MINRVAYLSMHTSPLVQPGVGDAGGMNVYIDELAKTMAARGVEVDVHTRKHRPDLEPVVEVGPGYRVHHIDAGPSATMPLADLVPWVRIFADRVVARMEETGAKPDVIHSNYWLSGWAGLLIKRALHIPHAISFHTLGRVKELTRRDDDSPESLLRIAAEHEVVEGADCVVAATPLEAEDLLEHYGADPARLCTSPPGVDHRLFRPGDQARARSALGWPAGAEVVLFVGRIQPLKGVDVAVEAFARVAERRPRAHLVLLGGPSGPNGDRELGALRSRLRSRSLEERVTMICAVPHVDLPAYYQAADVLVAPSRSESFGLVAAEAQACGLAVVAARIGGLTHVVADGESGLLVDGWDPSCYADAIEQLLADPQLRERLSRQAVEWSERFSWESTVHRFLELYDGAVARSDAR